MIGMLEGTVPRNLKAARLGTFGIGIPLAMVLAEIFRAGFLTVKRGRAPRTQSQ